MANGEGAGSFYELPHFTGSPAESAQVAAAFPGIQDGTSLRTVENGVMEADHPDEESTTWYNSAMYDEPDAPHGMINQSNGVGWYTMDPHADPPQFEPGDAAAEYNNALFKEYLPGYEYNVAHVDSSRSTDGIIEVRHDDGSGARFYDATKYEPPRGDYTVYEDSRGSQWISVHGTASVDRVPIYENGQAVYENGDVKTRNVESIRYRSEPSQYGSPTKRDMNDNRPPRSKRN